MHAVFHENNFTAICDQLAKRDKDLCAIIKEHGYPPMWTRPATFQTLILTILEQQVSLASAFAAFKKLRARIGYVTPAKILSLSDDDLRSCYFSRQKIVYARELANAIQTKSLQLKKLDQAHEDEIRLSLKAIKGIGDWTADSAGLGYSGGIAVFMALLAAVWAAYRWSKLSPTLLFWAAFVLTRPLGAVVGDFLDKPVAQGGLDLSRFGASGALLLFILICIAVFPQRAARSTH